MQWRRVVRRGDWTAVVRDWRWVESAGMWDAAGRRGVMMALADQVLVARVGRRISKCLYREEEEYK